jgi:cytochrome P450
LDEAIYRPIRERRRSGGDKGDLLSMLLLAEDADHPGERLSELEVRDQAMTIFFAGHETSAHALAWSWWLLASYPEVEEKMHAELRTVLSGRLPTIADVAQLPYLDCVLRESMRLYPPAWAIGRIAKVDHRLGDYHIPAGSTIIISQWVTHRDERHFPEAEKFCPERWTPAFRETLPRYAYFPFGGGPRTCIGEGFAWLELALVIGALAQRWRFRLTPETRALPQPRITLRPDQGILLKLERRP